MSAPPRAGWLLAVALAGPLLPGTALAIDPTGARYLEDVDELFWFVQITDSHVGADLIYGTRDTDNLRWVLDEAATTIQPAFVVLTGDIVDATNGGLVPTQQYQAEWEEYRGVVDGLGVDATFLHDLCGNHDTYRDEGATHYLANSLLGSTTGRLHDAWTHDTGAAEYLFVGLNSADVSGALPGFDDPGIAQSELTFLEDTLFAYDDARLAFVFTHHPLHALEYGAGELTGLFADHRVSVWANGHDHDHRVEFHGNTLHFNLDSLGKAEEHNLGLFAVDHDGVAARGFDVGDWPYVLVTAPVDAGLGWFNPYAYPVSAHHDANPVRALVFAPTPPLAVVFTVDDGPSSPMSEVAPSVYQGAWDATGFELGLHQLTVWVFTEDGARTHTIEVELAITQCDDGLDNDDNGVADFPDDQGCYGPSDDAEAGWVPPEPEDTGDTGLEDTDVDTSVTAGGCGCTNATPTALPPLGWLALVVALRRRRGRP